jgi:hypothetical protein
MLAASETCADPLPKRSSSTAPTVPSGSSPGLPHVEQDLTEERRRSARLLAIVARSRPPT